MAVGASCLRQLLPLPSLLNDLLLPLPPPQRRVWIQVGWRKRNYSGRWPRSAPRSKRRNFQLLFRPPRQAVGLRWRERKARLIFSLFERRVRSMVQRWDAFSLWKRRYFTAGILLWTGWWANIVLSAGLSWNVEGSDDFWKGILEEEENAGEVKRISLFDRFWVIKIIVCFQACLWGDEDDEKG